MDPLLDMTLRDTSPVPRPAFTDLEKDQDQGRSERKEISESKSDKSSTSIRKRSSPVPERVNIRKQDSVEISMSELEGIANNEKIREEFHEQKNISLKSASVKSRRDSDSDGGYDSEKYKHRSSRKYAKKVKRENKDHSIRKEKLDFLYKISQISMTYKKECSVSMENTLDDIETEYNRMSNEIQTIKGVDVCKTMLMLSVQGLEIANNKFDPVGVDLHGWSESLAYSIQNKDYDEVLAELYEKYKGEAQMMPELKLLLMLAGSAAMFAWTKRMAKTDPMEALGKMFSGNDKKSRAQPSTSATYTMPEESDSVVSSAKMDGPEDSINLNEVIQQMNTQKKRRGRPPGVKNKPKKNVTLV